MTLEEIIKGGNYHLIDVREPMELDIDGEIEGAVNIPLDQVESRVAEFEGKPSVVVFCRTGNRSSQAKEILESRGIKKVTDGVNVQTMEKEMQ